MPPRFDGSLYICLFQKPSKFYYKHHVLVLVLTLPSGALSYWNDGRLVVVIGCSAWCIEFVSRQRSQSSAVSRIERTIAGTSENLRAVQRSYASDWKRCARGYQGMQYVVYIY
jgi:hypothetical protein